MAWFNTRCAACCQSEPAETTEDTAAIGTAEDQKAELLGEIVEASAVTERVEVVQEEKLDERTIIKEERIDERKLEEKDVLIETTVIEEKAVDAEMVQQETVVIQQDDQAVQPTEDPLKDPSAVKNEMPPNHAQSMETETGEAEVAGKPEVDTSKMGCGWLLNTQLAKMEEKSKVYLHQPLVTDSVKSKGGGWKLNDTLDALESKITGKSA